MRNLFQPLADTVYIGVNTRERGPATALKEYWTPPEDPSPGRQALIDLLSVLSRVVPATFFSLVCYGFWNNFVRTGKWSSLLWLLSEGLVVLLLVFRRESHRLSRNPRDWIAALGGAFAVLLVRPAATAVIPDLFGVALQIIGTLFEVYAKFFLGRSFGIVAADRGIVTDGPYRIVRHPIYLGYLVTHVGFLLTNWSARNMAVYLVEYIFQVARILSEERLLNGDPVYRDYCGEVRYRLVPGIF
jgi:protein-S-isoprenylcysteine O-methyltransferase Ste14